MPLDRSWMWRRFDKNGFLSDEFDEGVREFLNFAYSHPEVVDRGNIKCPCTKCRNMRFQDHDTVHYHLKRFGFERGYTTWDAHGEPWIPHSTRESSYTQDGRTVSQVEVHDRTHRRARGEDDYVDNKSKRVRREYTNQHGSNPTPEASFDVDKWIQISGGPCRGRVYGFGNTYHYRELAAVGRSNDASVPQSSNYVAGGQLQEVEGQLQQVEGRLQDQLQEAEDRLQHTVVKVINKGQEEYLQKLEEDAKAREEAWSTIRAMVTAVLEKLNTLTNAPPSRPGPSQGD